MTKKRLSEIPLQSIKLIAQEATRQAARDAMAAGRTVAGWSDGRLVEYQTEENDPTTDAVVKGKN